MSRAGEKQCAERSGGVLPIATIRDGLGCARTAVEQAAALPDVSLPLSDPADESTLVGGARRDALILPTPIHRSTPHDETNVKGTARNG